MSVRLNWTMSLPSSSSRSATRRTDRQAHHMDRRDWNLTLHGTRRPFIRSVPVIGRLLRASRTRVVNREEFDITW